MVEEFDSKNGSPEAQRPSGVDLFWYDTAAEDVGIVEDFYDWGHMA